MRCEQLLSSAFELQQNKSQCVVLRHRPYAMALQTYEHLLCVKNLGFPDRLIKIVQLLKEKH